jgi:UDP-glucuronate 4-epimerase
MKKKIVIITGACGFIGFSMAVVLLKKNYSVIGIDNINNYYSTKYKQIRLKELKQYKNFSFKKINLENRNEVLRFLHKKKIDSIFHFAAQAGVRYSQNFPESYLNSNIYGFINILDASVKNNVKNIYYASSSSVYGDQKKYPVKENYELHPNNIYAKSKYLNELTAEFYSKRFNLNLVGLRLFTVYGKWGRPDMLLFVILKSYFLGKKFQLNNHGNHYRDFTYIDDVTNMIFLIFKKRTKYHNKIFNICSKNTIHIKKLITNIKKLIDINYSNIPKNSLDVYKTNGDNKKIINEINYKKKFTKIENVLVPIIEWYKKYKIYDLD